MKFKFIPAAFFFLILAFLTACFDDGPDMETTPALRESFTKSELINTILVREDYFNIHDNESDYGYRIFIFEKDDVWIMSGHGSQKYSWKIGRRGEVSFTHDAASSEFDDTCELWKIKTHRADNEDKISLRMTCEDKEQIVYQADYLRARHFTAPMLGGLATLGRNDKPYERFQPDGRVRIDTKRDEKPYALYRDYHADEKYHNAVMVDMAGKDGNWVAVSSKYRYFLMQGDPKSGKMVQLQYWQGPPPIRRHVLCGISPVNAMRPWVPDSFTCDYAAREREPEDGSLEF